MRMNFCLTASIVATGYIVGFGFLDFADFYLFVCMYIPAISLRVSGEIGYVATVCNSYTLREEWCTGYDPLLIARCVVM